MDTITNVGSVEGNNVEIDNVPFKRWFHLAVRMETKLWIFMSWNTVKRFTFEEIPNRITVTFMYANVGFPVIYRI